MRELRLTVLVLAASVLSLTAPGVAPLLASRAGALQAQEGAAKGARPKGEKKKASGDSASASKEKKDPRDKLVKDSTEAERQPLFAERTPLPFTLVANFNAINKNRDSTSKVRYPGTLVVKDQSGAERRIPVQLRTRGHFRLRRSTCKFVNLLVIFPGKGKEAEGTPFEGQKSLKLGAHCQDNHRYEDIVRREYLAYRVFNLITPRSFRARLSAATYVDSASGKAMDTRAAVWIENEDLMAARQGGRLREFRRALFDDMHAPTLDQMAIFEYLIGNTDWSIYALHNVRLVVDDSARVYPIPYDFDFSGLVSAPYSTPAPQLQIRSVRDRLFRGPCRTLDELLPSVQRFTSRKGEILALLDEVPDLDERERRDAKDYLESFFPSVADANGIKEAFIDRCLRKPGA